MYRDAFDTVRKTVEERYDVQDGTLTKLIRMAWTNNGIVSLHRREQFANEVIPEIFDLIEESISPFMSQTPAGESGSPPSAR